MLLSEAASHRRCSIRNGVLRGAHVFSCKFCEVSKNTFFTERLWATASVLCQSEPNDKEDNQNILLTIMSTFQYIAM